MAYLKGCDENLEVYNKDGTVTLILIQDTGFCYVFYTKVALSVLFLYWGLIGRLVFLKKAGSSI